MQDAGEDRRGGEPDFPVLDPELQGLLLVDLLRLGDALPHYDPPDIEAPPFRVLLRR